MYTAHEALARDRMRQLHQQAQHYRLIRELPASARWRRPKYRDYHHS